MELNNKLKLAWQIIYAQSSGISVTYNIAYTKILYSKANVRFSSDAAAGLVISTHAVTNTSCKVKYNWSGQCTFILFTIGI